MARQRLNFTQAELNRMAEAAAKYGVPITIERVAPDGTKVTATADKTHGRNGESNNGVNESDLDKWMRERDACATEGH